MLYQGEDIAIELHLDDEIVSAASYYRVLVYAPNTSSIWQGDIQATEVKNGKATVTIPSVKTRRMVAGMYTVEVLAVTTGNTRSIYQQKGAFELHFSKIKMYE